MPHPFLTMTMMLPYICPRIYKLNALDPSLIIRGEPVKVLRLMRGLGDTIYQRALIDSGVVDTPWAELFEDKPEVFCVKSDTDLRTQKKNADAYQDWCEKPSYREEVQVDYNPSTLAIARNIIRVMERYLGHDHFSFDLPDFGKSPVKGKYVVIKPNTVRSEWMCPARNCKSEYINKASLMLKKKGYKIIGIADVAEGEEWLDGIPPYVDEAYYEGEFNIKELVSLVRGAELMVSSVGWPVPMCLATGTRLICIGGGLGRFNNPEMITDPRMEHIDEFKFIEPDEYCMCGNMNHDCKKEISDFDSQFKEAIN